MEKNDNDHGLFHGIGKGVFLALILFALPGFLILNYYDRIEASLTDISDLPVYDRMQDNFETGAQVVGALFETGSGEFYDIDSTFFSTGHRGDETGEPMAASPARYWNREELEQQLGRRLSAGKQQSVRAYLQYIEQYKSLALDEMRRTKIPASVTLAQGLFEGNAGRGYLASEANNHFGIKCQLQSGYRRDGRIGDNDFGHHSLAIGCVQRTDDYVWDRFEVYPSARESFRRHSLLLLGDRYRWMIREYEIGKMYPIPVSLYGHDRVPYYAAWGVGLKKSGYATAKDYAEKITLIIETYQLWKIDYELLMI
ncbi:MAG: glucosaminidase domain-containing protein [Lewinellaceae bacterium]|nr:glucosaminidase domain-containing protein [Lewinellaceae bacterium]